ncbi:MAG: S-adenosylmethionine decarboxylase [bacterium]|nr:S-adenosylmethionine decarboxylase [bacterium]
MLNNPNPHETDYFGQELVLNLYDCDLAKISSEEEIRKFVVTLCDDVIKMVRYGEAQIPHFGHDNPITSGYSLVQLIETSSITGHFSEHKRSAYLNIFSCAWFDPEKAGAFAQDFFGAKHCEKTLLKRS